MAYADYEFYEKEYLMGREPLIPEKEFLFYEAKARRTIRMYTLERSDVYVDDDAVKLCTCALAEKYFNLESDESSNANSGIASEKVGEYSVTYKEKSMETIKQEVITILRDHLAVTGLLFRGI